MEDVALLGSYDEEMGAPPGEGVSDGGGEGEEEEAHVRVMGMTCSACTSAVEAAVSARRGVRRVAVSLLQNRARVVFAPALVKVRWRDPCVFFRPSKREGCACRDHCSSSMRVGGVFYLFLRINCSFSDGWSGL